METSASIHHGPYESIPSSASPGLRFLQRLLPALDTLDPTDHPIGPLFTPNAPVLIGSNPPSAASQAVPLLEVRSRHLERFHHHLHVAWDLDLSHDSGPDHTSYSYPTTAADGEGHIDAEQSDLYAPLRGNIRMKRTVMFEATCETVFKNDPDQFPVKVREFNVVDLEGRDESDLQVVEMRIFMDSRPVQARAASLQMESAFGESQREADPG
ncbi:hypothetical protein NUU61_003496 [Penicillium alfredii]|uniref:Uncharacterized protein n=1 Tax=Penicillium alfredii TaxID=1506179 RepID=A0A9W9FJC9_9EURO|nr:uncharacterized protein NUU61_003496 [Penicillium alfredii]KAJ5101274.1 hypothetical protein NUU61_003496 [Penicillium alfredii]